MFKEVNDNPKNKETIIRFDRVSFEWGVNKRILDEVSFSFDCERIFRESSKKQNDRKNL